MEMNKDDALKCKTLGVKYLKEKNYANCIKFLEKSLRLYPLPGVQEMKERAEKEMKTSRRTSPRSSANANMGARNRFGATSNDSSSAKSSTTAPSEPQRPYTAAQVEIVQKIKTCRTHYEVLGVSKQADENEIKKAYRQLALKLHPDKNTAPGAESAFKAVGKAFATLSDASKRKEYDLYGDEDSEQPRGGGRRRRQYAHEATPEEIFEMFFGGGMHGGGLYRGGQSAAQQRHQQSNGGTNGMEGGRSRGGLVQMLQVLPLLVVFFLSFFSYPETDTQPFSFQRSNVYSVSRGTQTRGVLPDIPYFVNQHFARTYGRDYRELQKVERKVERLYYHSIEQNCLTQREKQKRMIYQARQKATDELRESAMRRALDYKMPDCEELQKFKNRVY